MATQITEQARSSLDSPVATIDEARDLNSQRASSLLDLLDPTQWPARDDGPPSLEEVACNVPFRWDEVQTSDYLPTSAGSGSTSPKSAAGRGF